MKKFFALLLISALLVGCSKAFPDNKRTEQRSREAFNELERSTK